MSNANSTTTVATQPAARKEIGFFRSLASPVYMLGRFLSAGERVANVLDMYAEKLETETEITLVPALTKLAISRAEMAAKVAAGNLE